MFTGTNLKLGIRLVLGVEKVLNFGHGELANAKKAVAGRNFIAESLCIK